MCGLKKCPGSLEVPPRRLGAGSIYSVFSLAHPVGHGALMASCKLTKHSPRKGEGRGSGLNFVKRSPRENTSPEVRFGVGVGVGVGAPHNRACASSDGSNKPPMTVLYRAPSALPPLMHSTGFSSFSLSVFRSKVLLLDEPN